MSRVKHILDKYQKDYIPAGIDVTMKHKDYFNMKQMYDTIHEWLIEEEWATRADETFPEDFYLQRETQQTGNELWIWWRLSKFPNNVPNSYYKYEMDIDFHVILLKSVEVVRNNVKYKVNHGEPEIKINTRVIVDWQRNWRDHWLLKHFHELFRNRLFWGTLLYHKRNLYRETYRLQESLKTYFKLKTYLPESEGQRFYPGKEGD